MLWLISSAETVGLFFKQAPGGQDYFKLVSFGYELIGLHLLVLAAQRLADRPAIGSALALLGRYSFFIYLIHLPLAPKLFEAIAGHSALAASLPLKMLARGLICIALPIGLALSFQLLGSGTRLTRRIGQTLGIPV
jgi:peptidoglycan/LPS O-acetylase OafA/YrhL